VVGERGDLNILKRAERSLPEKVGKMGKKRRSREAEIQSTACRKGRVTFRRREKKMEKKETREIGRKIW